MKKSKIIIGVSIVVGIFYIGITKGSNIIFQEGNPIPYLSKIITLNVNNKFAKIYEKDGTIRFITNEDDEATIKIIEDDYKVKLSDQMGSAYFFESRENEESGVLATRKQYMSFYTIWDISLDS